MSLPVYEPYTIADMFLEGYWLWTAFVFAFGACIGSFLNVCIYRIPKEMSVVAPRSHCPRCEQMIAWYDNIPLLSWLLLRAKCRHCGLRISPRYFLVEFLTGALFVLAWMKFGLPEETSRMVGLVGVTDPFLVPVYWLVISGLVLGTFVDFDYMILPDRVTIGGIIVGLILSTVLPVMHGQEDMLRGLMFSAIGAASGGLLLWTVAMIGSFIFKKDAMGMGDVKLLAAIGAFFGWGSVIFCVAVSSLFGSVAGLSLIAMKKKEMGSRIPYGPYIALAALIWMFWGESLWDWYLELFRPEPMIIQL